MCRTNPMIMRRLHGDGPRSAVCGECVHYRKRKEESSSGIGRCRAETPKRRWVVASHWLSCGLFMSPWRAERERLEAMGQQTTTFGHAGGGVD